MLFISGIFIEVTFFSQVTGTTKLNILCEMGFICYKNCYQIQILSLQSSEVPLISEIFIEVIRLHSRYYQMLNKSIGPDLLLCEPNGCSVPEHCKKEATTALRRIITKFNSLIINLSLRTAKAVHVLLPCVITHPPSDGKLR